MVDWERITETRGWHRGLDGRSLRLDLRRRLSAHPDGVHLLLDPDSTTTQSYRDIRWKKSELPPCRLVWVGDLIESSAQGSPDFEALVTLIGPGAAAGDFTAVRLPAIAHVSLCERRACAAGTVGWRVRGAWS